MSKNKWTPAKSGQSKNKKESKKVKINTTLNNPEMSWTKSPITKKMMVMTEVNTQVTPDGDFPGKDGGTHRMDLSTGFYTNDNPLNYKKYPDYPIEMYEKNMPKITKKLRFDDGESYWYPSSLRTHKEWLFAVGTKDYGEAGACKHVIYEGGKPIFYRWCYVKVLPLTEKEQKDAIGQPTDDDEIKYYESKLDMANAEFYPEYLLAARRISGYSLGNIFS